MGAGKRNRCRRCDGQGERLKIEDTPDKESIGRVLTEYESDVQRNLRWWESQ